MKLSIQMKLAFKALVKFHLTPDPSPAGELLFSSVFSWPERGAKKERGCCPSQALPLYLFLLRVSKRVGNPLFLLPPLKQKKITI